MRQVRWRDPATYMEQALAGQAMSNEERITRKALPFEFMLNALRLREGFALSTFLERTGLPPSSLAAGLEQAESRGLIQREGDWIAPTARGFDFLSDLQQIFL